MAELKVEIGADIKNLESSVKKASSLIKGFGSKSGKDLNSFGKNANVASKSMKNLGGATKANALPALNEFSRVIQDAPFGIMGVANNITQLTTQFQYLSKNAGGTGSALKTMLGSLSGPAGMLLIISAVTSAMVAFGDKMKFAKKATDGLGKATKDYLVDAKSEITTLNQLLSISRNESNSKKVRQRAVNELNKKYPEYLGNLTIESSKTDAVTKSVDRLSTSLVRKAKVEGLSALIKEKTAETAEKLIDLDVERLKQSEKIRKSIKELNSTNLTNIDESSLDTLEGLESALDKASLATRGFKSGNVKILRGLKASSVAYKNITEDITKLEDKTSKALKPLLSLQTALKIDSFESDIPKKTGVKTKITTLVDLDIAKAKEKIAKLNLTLSDLGGKERFNALTKIFIEESKLIDAKYKNEVAQAGKNKNALKAAKIEKSTALINLEKDFNSDLLSLSKRNLSQELSNIKTSATLEKNASLKALIDKYNAIGALTVEQSKELASKKKSIEVQSNNESITRQNEYLNKLLADENLNSILRLEVERNLQANLAKLQTESSAATLERVSTFQSEMNKLLSNESIAGGLSGAIANAFSQGGNIVANLGNALLGQLGQFLSKMGALLVEYGTLAILKGKLDLAIASGGIISIGAGIAAVAVGAALSAAGAALGNASTGGSNAGSSSDSGTSGSNVSYSNNGGSSGGRYVFEIQGTKLVGVLQNTLNRNRALGGNITFN